MHLSARRGGCHRAQGPGVRVPDRDCPGSARLPAGQAMLYTAVIRGRERVMLVRDAGTACRRGACAGGVAASALDLGRVLAGRQNTGLNGGGVALCQDSGVLTARRSSCSRRGIRGAVVRNICLQVAVATAAASAVLAPVVLVPGWARSTSAALVCRKCWLMPFRPCRSSSQAWPWSSRSPRA